MDIIDQIEKANQFASEVFEDCPNWANLPDENKARFSLCLWLALKEWNRELKA